jgi:hypothetical protein
MKRAIFIAALAALLFAPTIESSAQLMGGGFIQKTASVAPSCLSLDCVTDTAAVAYSTVKLRAAYAGNCMTIERTSDSTTQVIGFVGNNCDQATASTFCAATTCFLTVWNDQTGNGLNCTPDSAARSPQVLFSNVNGKMALDFNRGTGSNCRMTGSFSPGVAATTIQGVFNDPGIDGSPGDWWTNGAFGDTAFTDLITNGNTTQGFAAVRNDGTGAKTSLKTASFNTWYSVFATLTNTRSAIFVNGVEGVDDTSSITLATKTTGGSSNSGFTNGLIAEIIVWNPSISDVDGKTVCRAEGATFAITTSC